MIAISTMPDVNLLEVRIDKNSPIPVYVQISDAIRTLIRGGALTPESPLPPSSILCQHFGITRMTLRQAYNVLEREDLIQPQRGRGTFVSRPKIEKSLREMSGFTEEMLAAGKVPSSRLIRVRQIKPGLEARDFFRLPEGARVFEMVRLRLSNNIPIAIEEVQIPEHMCPGLDRLDWSNQSLYNQLEERYGLKLARCVEVISAALPSREEKQLLEIDRTVALLKIKRQSYTSSDVPAELALTSYRGDLYTAVIRAERGHQGNAERFPMRRFVG
jgi:GntR family transcriptional regulator